MNNLKDKLPAHLPPSCPVKILSGSYRNRTGLTLQKPEADGLQWVLLTAKAPKGPVRAQFTRSQLQDLRPAAQTPAAL